MGMKERDFETEIEHHLLTHAGYTQSLPTNFDATL